MDRRELADNSEDAPEEALLVAFANGDGGAGRILVERLAPRVLAHATRVLGNAADAEDVVQEAMIRLWRIAPDWRQGEAKVSTWLFKVTANLCTDRLRARSRAGHVELDRVTEPISLEPSAVQQMTDQERSDHLTKALSSLPERQRQAVVLRHIDGLGNLEIAAVMDISVEAVESLTARGKRALSNALFGHKDELGFSDE